MHHPCEPLGYGVVFDRNRIGWIEVGNKTVDSGRRLYLVGRIADVVMGIPMTARILGAISPSEPWGGPFPSIDYDIHALHGATNDLFDRVLTMTPSEALSLVKELNAVRGRLDAVISRAFDQANGFTEE